MQLSEGRNCRGVLVAPSCCAWRRVRFWPSFRLAPDRTDARSQSRSSLRAPGDPAGSRLSYEHRQPLTVILVGFGNGRAGRMAPVRAGAAGLRRSTGAANCPSAARRRSPSPSLGRYSAGSTLPSWCHGFEFAGQRLQLSHGRDARRFLDRWCLSCVRDSRSHPAAGCASEHAS